VDQPAGARLNHPVDFGRPEDGDIEIERRRPIVDDQLWDELILSRHRLLHPERN
jgi:hypothetical protein